MSKQNAEFEIVVYGATSFTGQLVAEYLLAAYPGDQLRWAMAGRNADKLASVRDELGAPADIPLIVADAADPAAVRAMLDRTRCIVTTVGPLPVVRLGIVRRLCRNRHRLHRPERGAGLDARHDTKAQPNGCSGRWASGVLLRL